jgi:NAD dependent epimerase/dehydratase family enzyme
VLSRDPARAKAAFGAAEVQALQWDLMSEPAPAQALAGRDAVVHLAGENVAQRWTAKAREAIRESRVTGTRHLLEGLREAGRVDPSERPHTLVSASAIGYYGQRGEEPLDEDAPAGRDFLARVCADWELEAERASELGMRVVEVRTGVVLDSAGGALPGAASTCRGSIATT